MIRLTRAERFQDARTVYNQHGRQSMDEVSAATGVTKAVIQALEDSDSTRSVGCEKIAKLAKHYNVTTDYLLGLSDDPAPTRSAVDELGLPHDVVKTIIKLKEYAEANVDDSLKGFVLFMRMFGESPIFEMISVLQDDISNEDSNEPISLLKPGENPRYFSRQRNERMAENKLRNELIDAHPELSGRIDVICGSFLLQQELRQICDFFRETLQDELGYNDIVNAVW